MSTNRTRPEVAQLLREFGATLDNVRTLAGRGFTYRRLAEQAKNTRGVPLPIASIHRLLHGHTRPEWAVVAQFLKLLGQTEQDIQQTWYPRWLALMEKINAIEHATGAVVLFDSIACALCGVAVVDPQLHQRWHAENEALMRRSTIRVVPHTRRHAG